MQFDMSDRVAIVTGAAGNIGAAICRKLRDQGVTVVAADMALEDGEDSRKLDVTDEQSWQSLIGWVSEHHGRLDILVHNAGVAPMDKLEETDLAVWRKCQSVNVEGVFLGIKSATALLRESGARLPAGASVIVISSASSNRATPFAAAYATSKAGVSMLTKSAGIEFKALGYPIRCNSIHPACVKSDMIDNILKRYSVITGGVPIPDLHKAMIEDHPYKRMVEPDEVADAVVFLASDASAYINASELNVDGGLTAN